MAHMVKCKVCGKSFDRDKIQAVKVGANRYAHFKTFNRQNEQNKQHCYTKRY